MPNTLDSCRHRSQLQSSCQDRLPESSSARWPPPHPNTHGARLGLRSIARPKAGSCSLRRYRPSPVRRSSVDAHGPETRTTPCSARKLPSSHRSPLNSAPMPSNERPAPSSSCRRQSPLGRMPRTHRPTRSRPAPPRWSRFRMHSMLALMPSNYCPMRSTPGQAPLHSLPKQTLRHRPPCCCCPTRRLPAPSTCRPRRWCESLRWTPQSTTTRDCCSSYSVPLTATRHRSASYSSRSTATTRYRSSC
ncbi:hypothetical protein X879_2615 [Burkholderia pseudomallei MSHR3951]|nr:hypothetical protein X879_2615 [Burkholderia pseudomallei MSHR3951]